jgi:spore coat protein A, manganese oxidase
MITRRQFLKLGAAAGAGLLLPEGLVVRRAGPASAVSPWLGARAAAAAPLGAFALPGGTLDPAAIPKYITPLVIPPAMPRTARIPGSGNKEADYYEIAVRQFQQQILPPPLPPTTVWGYGSVNHPGTFNYPAFTIEAKYTRPVRVKWLNQLVDANGNYLPHLLTVDPTLHWANPPGGTAGRDMRPTFSETPGPYTGPVPLVAHLHGGHSAQESDGFPEAWYLPAATNMPAGYATTGTYYDIFKASSPLGASWDNGFAVFQYPNDQRAAALWYHDHTLGMTRVNVYAGPAGFYLLRGGPSDLVGGTLPGPAPALGDLPGTRYYEIPLAIQDRAFNADGSLFYPTSRAFFDGFEGPYIPGDDTTESDIAPFHNPEFFGNTMVVNGRTWPSLEVEQRRYRFRLLNGCNSRFLILQLSNGQPFWQLGAEGGFLPAPVPLDQLLLAPAERADVIVDFSDVPVGTQLILQNLGPDEPFGGGEPPDDFDAADPATTGQVLQFRVVKRVGADKSTPADRLVLPALPMLPAASTTRRLSLNELDSAVLEGVGPREARLGTLGDEGIPVDLPWMDDVTETPTVGATEVWELYNFTADAHPIHLHQVQFQVVDRQALATDEEGLATSPAQLVGDPLRPEPWETGYKDTVIAYPGQVTRIKATFDLAGRYVWHCHIVEHEDNEMMRPFQVG